MVKVQNDGPRIEKRQLVGKEFRNISREDGVQQAILLESAAAPRRVAIRCCKYPAFGC